MSVKSLPRGFSAEARERVADLTEQGVEFTSFESTGIRAMVPLDLIHDEGVVVGGPRVDELQKSIRQEKAKGHPTGIIVPPFLGDVVNFHAIDVADGFHRVEASRLEGTPRINSIIELSMTRRRLLDHRIFATAGHTAIRFARVLDWVEEAWELDEVSSMAGGINVSQAFILAATDGESALRLGLSEDQADEIIAWVNARSTEWVLPIERVRENLLSSENMFVSLLKRLRDPDPDHPNMPVCTMEHLETIAGVFEGDEDWQLLMADAVLEKGLKVEETRSIAWEMTEYGADIEAAREALAELDIRDYRRAQRKAKQTAKSSGIKGAKSISISITQLELPALVDQLDARYAELAASATRPEVWDTERIGRARRVGEMLTQIAEALEPNDENKKAPEAMVVLADTSSMSPSELALYKREQYVNFVKSGNSERPLVTTRQDYEAARKALQSCTELTPAQAIRREQLQNAVLEFANPKRVA